MRAVEGFFFLALLAFLLCLSASGSFAKAVNSSEKTYSEEPVVSVFSLDDVNFDEGSLTHASKDNRIVFLRTIRGDVFRSNASGANMTLVTVPSVMERINHTSGKIWRLEKGALMPDGTYVMYFWSALAERNPSYRQMIWKTSDGGLTFQLLPLLPFPIDYIRPHPVLPNVCLALQYTPSPTKGQAHKSLDFGTTFTPIFKPLFYAPRFRWAPTPSNPYRIIAFVTIGISASSVAFWNNKVLQSDNFFEDYRVLIEHVHDYSFNLIEASPAQASSPRSSSSSITTLIPELTTSSNASFHRDVWPSHGPPESDLLVFASKFADPGDTSRLHVSLSTNPGYTYENPFSAWKPTSFPMGGYASSGSWGYNVFSLKRNSSLIGAHQRDGRSDIYRVERRKTSELDAILLLRDYKSSTLQRSETIPGTMTADRYFQSSESKRSGSIKSYVTGNGGASWQQLRAPVSDEGERKYLTCVGVNNDSPLLYDAPKSLGMLFITATVVNETHPYFPMDVAPGPRPPVSTYVSNDGGFNWKEIGAGSHVPEFTANGAMWATSPNGVQSDSLTFSLDDGLSWRTIRFTDYQVSVFNIRSPSDFNSRVFYVHALRQWTEPHVPPPSTPSPEQQQEPHYNSGEPSSPIESAQEDAADETSQTDPSAPTGSLDPVESPSAPYNYSTSPEIPPKPSAPVTTTTTPPPPSPTQHFRFADMLFTLDFTDAFPLCTESDYEEWVPVDSDGRQRCTMGEKITFKRRKKGAFCFPQPPPTEDQSQHPWPIVVKREACACTMEDFECAPCFARNETSGRCQFVCGLESSNFLSRYGSIPWRDSICDVNANTVYEWPSSAAFAYQKIEDSLCRLEELPSFRDAVVPCIYAPTLPTPVAPPTRAPFSLSPETRKALSVVFVVSGIFLGGFLFVRFFGVIRSAVGMVVRFVVPQPDYEVVGRMDFEDFDLDAAEEEVELEDLPIAETTTSSEEDEPDMEPSED